MRTGGTEAIRVPHAPTHPLPGGVGTCSDRDLGRRLRDDLPWRELMTVTTVLVDRDGPEHVGPPGIDRAGTYSAALEAIIRG